MINHKVKLTCGSTSLPLNTRQAVYRRVTRERSSDGNKTGCQSNDLERASVEWVQRIASTLVRFETTSNSIHPFLLVQSPYNGP